MGGKGAALAEGFRILFALLGSCAAELDRPFLEI